VKKQHHVGWKMNLELISKQRFLFCHSEHTEDSTWIWRAMSHWILRFAQNDKPLLHIPALTLAARNTAYCTFSLPGGVMVAQVTLTHLVMVRIHAGQPFDTGLFTFGPCLFDRTQGPELVERLMACGPRRMALSEVEGLYVVLRSILLGADAV
jgi:hypothetical protein